MKYVQQVRGNWVVRMVVPEELRGIIGQRELVEIGLPNEARAREKRAVAVINAFHAKLDEAREVWESLGEASKPTLSSAAKEHFRAELLFDDMERAVAMDPATSEMLARHRSVYANRLRLLVAGRMGIEEAEALIGYAADALTREGRAPQGLRMQLLATLAQIQLEALEHFEDRDSGRTAERALKHPLLTQPDPVAKEMSGTRKGDATGITLSVALQSFHKERTAGGNTLAAKTMEEHKNAARMFNEFMGGETNLQAITKKDVIDYKQALLATPNRYTMRFPGLTLPQAIKANAKLAEPFPALAPKTINMKWLSHLSTILQWASNNGHIETNPAQGIRVDTGSKVHREPSYLAFTKDELRLIFGHTMFDNPKTYGLNEWALLVMLYTETHLIVAHEVTNQGFDREQLSQMAIAAKAALGRDELHAIADKGYFSGPEILACHEAGIMTTVPRPATSGNAAKGMYVKADFVYDAERDVYVCPAGEDLTYRYTTEERGIPIRRYWINGCKTCPLRTHCTTGNERRISRWEREDLVDDMDSRLGRDPDYMTLRRCTVEHPFGTIKAWMGGTHFLTRRLKNVRSEMALNVLAYNIKRMVALLGVRGLMRAMRG